MAFSEIDPFPCAVLKHHYPSVPNWGDMTKFREWPDACSCDVAVEPSRPGRVVDALRHKPAGDGEHAGIGAGRDRAAGSGVGFCARCGGTVIDLLVGGTPCQSFSVAGLRKGLADPRGNLALTYLAILDRYRPAWCCWENVPGVLSADDGGALGAFLGGLGELGYGFAYRVLDAQYFGLAQRRKRVFVIGYLGDWRRAAAVLFERESLSGHPAPRREAWQVAPTVPSRRTAGGGIGTVLDCDGGVIQEPIPLQYAEQLGREKRQNGMGIGDPGNPMFTLECRQAHGIAYALRGDGFDASEDGTGRGTPIAFSSKDYGNDAGELCPTMRVCGKDGGAVMPAVAFDARQSDVIQYGDKTGPLDTCWFTMAVAFQESQSGFRATDAHPTLDSHNGSRRHHGVMVPAVTFSENQRAELVEAETVQSLNNGGGKPGQGYPAVRSGMQVRRLTPRECERLQGFSDDYTLVPYRGKPAADGNRYKALGNSMAVPVMAWIGRRIQLLEDALAEGVA
jgi:DNA (cytosine-5)-methyltransferase 1